MWCCCKADTVEDKLDAHRQERPRDPQAEEVAEPGAKEPRLAAAFNDPSPTARGTPEHGTRGQPREKEVSSQAQFWLKEASHAAQLGQWAEAIGAYTEAVNVEPGAAAAWAGRGSARLQKGDMQDALNDLNEAIRLQPDCLQAYRDRAEVRAQTGDYDGAAQDGIKIRSLELG